MMRLPALKSLAFIPLCLLVFLWSNAQKPSSLPNACTGSVGDPLVHIDFGSGPNYGPQLPAGTTNFLTYLAQDCPWDGCYSIVNSTPGCWAGDWHAVNADHTGNPNGYFMLVNAAIAPSDFYVTTASGLCGDTTYEISFAILNIHKTGILPNITVRIEDMGGALLTTYNTGPIPLTATPTWSTYSVTANLGTNTTVRVRLRNNAPGGVGNDLCLDDIMFRPIGPTIAPDIAGYPGGVANITTAVTTNLNLNATVGACYTTNVLQWQMSSDNGVTWTDIAGATNLNYSRPPTGVGTYLYRLAVSPLAGSGNPTCRVFSNPVTVNVTALPGCATAPTLNTVQSCATGTAISVTFPLGANYQYSINGTTYQPSPVFNSVPAGSYNVTYQDTSLGCTSPGNPVTVGATVIPTPPAVTTPVRYCQGATAVPLSATASPGNTLVWYGTNATGGTGSATAPTPSTAAGGSTTYYVAQSNGTCESTRAAIVVTVQALTSPPPATNPYCDLAHTDTTHVGIDWANVVPFQMYHYTYSIAGGPPISGQQYAPSNTIIPVPGPGTTVVFTMVSEDANPCMVSQTIICHSTCLSSTVTTFNAIQNSYCLGAAPAVLPTTSSNGVVGVWAPTTISTATAGTTNYVFTPDEILDPCATPYTLSVTVNAPVTPTFAAIPATVCQNAAYALPTTSTNATPITGSWSPALNTATLGTATYTFVPAAGQCVTAAAVQATITVLPNTTPNFAAIAPICSGTTAPVLSNTSPNGIVGSWSPATINAVTPGTTSYTFTPNANQCATTQVLSVTVNPRLTPNFAPIAPICSGSVAPGLATTSPNGIPGTWSPSTINNTTGGTYVFTPSAGQCADSQTLTVTVNPRITPSFASVAPVCRNSTAPVLPTSSNDSPPITGSWSPAVSTATVGTTVYTFTPTAGQCVTNSPIQLSITVVSPNTPNFALIPPFCAGTTAPVLATTSPNGIEGTWSPATVNNQTTGTYVFTPGPNECANTQSLTITVTQRTNPDFAAIAPFCAGDTAPVLNPASPNGITGTWSPAIVDNMTSGTYVFTPDATQCANPQTLAVTVNQPLDPGFDDIEFCSGATAPVLTSVSPNGVPGSWNPSAIDNTLSSSYVFTPDVGECASVQTIQVTVHEQTLFGATWTVTNAFEDNQIITIMAANAGDYLYQLDYGPFQDSPVFSDVLAGTHTIVVKDRYGCSPPVTESNVMVINYPKYFTPNDDGFHDTWNVTGLIDQNAKISIFDRHGKLIKQISSSGLGWDGTYNGHDMPANDYWFTIEFVEQQVKKEFKAHFALKR